MSLSNLEQETIVNFNQGEDTAHIFTYSEVWQRHLERKLGLKPVSVNSFGGKNYELPKSFIGLPRGPRRLSTEERVRRQVGGRKLQVTYPKKRQGEPASAMPGPPKEEGEKCVV